MQRDDLERIMNFLNGWGRCRLERKVFIHRFPETYNKTRPLLEPFRDLRLEDFDFDRLFDVGTERMKACRIIHLAFDELASARHSGPTATSKVLHLFSPSFFVMWDRSICCETYKLRPNGYDYANSFLPEMQDRIQGVIDDVTRCKRFQRQEAIEYIHGETLRICKFSKSLAKIIDEYNFTKAHPR